MQRFSLRTLSFAALTTLGMLGSAAAPAQAGSYGHGDYGHGYAPPCHWEWVTVYERREVAYEKTITLYDHCGRPYEVTKTFFRTVRVPVQKHVRVCD